MPERSSNSEEKKDPHAVELGRRGGLKGGKARAAKLSKEERSESARKAAQARWAKQGKRGPAREAAPESVTGRGELMTRARPSVLAAVVLLAGALTLSLVLLTRGSAGTGHAFVSKLGQSENAAETPGLGPTSYEAFRQAMRTYPAKVIPVSVTRRAKATFIKIARADARALKRSGRRHLLWNNHEWKLYGPRTDAVQPGVTSFSGATNTTASRVTALITDPDCNASRCGLWVGVSGGGVWRTENALAPNPTWQQLTPEDLDQNSVRSLVLDPTNSRHLLVGSTLAVRGLSHVIGGGGTTRTEPGANAPGLYESFDGGNTFTEVWNGNSATSFGVIDVGLDPLDHSTVYASAFDAGAWRRDAGAAATNFQQVFAPQFPGGGTDRTMFALTVKGGHTRIYLTDGTANGGGFAGALASN